VIDDDDVTAVAWIFSGITGWFTFALAAVAISVTAYVACENTKECETHSCPSQKHAELLEGRCVCVEAAK
jgi:hypothetical protein